MTDPWVLKQIEDIYDVVGRIIRCVTEERAERMALTAQLVLEHGLDQTAVAALRDRLIQPPTVPSAAHTPSSEQELERLRAHVAALLQAVEGRPQ